jgi:hypothetical protein
MTDATRATPDTLRVGMAFRDNRKPSRVLTVKRWDHESVTLADQSGVGGTIVSIRRLYLDARPRASGWSLMQ